jgi:hypothetical protein
MTARPCVSSVEARLLFVSALLLLCTEGGALFIVCLHHGGKQKPQCAQNTLHCDSPLLLYLVGTTDLNPRSLLLLQCDSN